MDTVEPMDLRPGDRVTVDGLTLIDTETVLRVTDRTRLPGGGARIVYEGIDRGEAVGGAFTVGGEHGHDAGAVTIHRLS